MVLKQIFVVMLLVLMVAPIWSVINGNAALLFVMLNMVVPSYNYGTNANASGNTYTYNVK